MACGLAERRPRPVGDQSLHLLGHEVPAPVDHLGGGVVAMALEADARQVGKEEASPRFVILPARMTGTPRGLTT